MIKKVTIFLSFLSFVGFIIAGCDENPVDNDDDHDHAEAEAMLITMGSDTLLYQDEIDGVLASGEIQITEGNMSDTAVVVFLDHDGDHFQPEEDHFSLSVESDDDSIAEPSVHNRWEFVVSGNAAGDTYLTVQLMHDDHPDFTGDQIDVHVH